MQRAAPLTLFYSYAYEDEPLREQLEKHLRLLSRQGHVSTWHSRQIVAGTEWEKDIDEHLNTASIILLLISPDFLASDYCYDKEMQRALERHAQGEARVIPVLLRPCDWHSAPFARLQCVPHDGKAVTEWDNQDTAFLTIAQALRRTIEQFTSSVLPTPARQNRTILLKRVRKIWIEGLLEYSLHQAAWIDLHLQERLDALVNPWRLQVQEFNRTPRLLPAGTSIVQVYDEADGELLILGDPGAGKTTLLLELARTLLERAERNTYHPLPIILHLSSWANKRLPLTAWIIEELWTKYQVSRTIGASFLATDQILLLLDGLDEVTKKHRSECIDAINTYRHEHSLVPLVVCSRSTEYFSQTVRVLLHRAIVVQPLTTQQIDTYLSSAGEQLAALRVALGDDPELQEMAATPLMLNVLTLAYQGRSDGDPITACSPGIERRQQVFTDYVHRMLQRRGAEAHYTSQQTICWLTWLGQQMARYGQAEFYVERIQPDWLPKKQMHQFYGTIAKLIVGLILGLPTGLILGIILELVARVPFGLISGVISGVIIGLVVVLHIKLRTEIQPAEIVIWSWGNIWRSFIQSFFSEEARKWLDLGVFFGLINGLRNGFITGVSSGMLDEHHLTWPNEGIWLSARNGVFTCLIIWLVCFLIFVPFILLLVFSAGPIAMLEGSSLVGGLLNSPETQNLVLASGLIVGMIIGLVNGLRNGGEACIKHFILRFFLFHTGFIPWDLPRFLDYAVERILLRKVGGGYIFIHRLLLDYFAALEKKDP